MRSLKWLLRQVIAFIAITILLPFILIGGTACLAYTGAVAGWILMNDAIEWIGGNT